MCLTCFLSFFLDAPQTPVLVRTITRVDGPPVTVLSVCPALMSWMVPTVTGAANRLLARIILSACYYYNYYYYCVVFVVDDEDDDDV